ncbi:MAG: transporter substrate-binding domain-containing protein [Sedimenticola sp.]
MESQVTEISSQHGTGEIPLFSYGFNRIDTSFLIKHRNSLRYTLSPLEEGSINQKSLTVRAGAPLNWLTIICLLFGLSFLPAADATVAEINKQARRTIIVGSELDYPPYATVDKSGNATGFSVDLIRAVANEIGIKLKFQVGPWSEVKLKLERGEIDALPLVAYSTERDKIFDFSRPHIISHSVAFIREDMDNIASVADLRGKEVIVMRQDATHEYVINSRITDKVTLTKTLGDAFKLLSSGKHDFVISPKLSGLLLLRELGIDNIKPFGEPLEAYGRGYAFAVHEGNNELLDQLDHGLVLIKVSGQYDQIYDQWFGHVNPANESYEALIRNVFIGAGLITLCILTVVTWNFLLRRQVNYKTVALATANEEIKSFAYIVSHDLRSPLVNLKGFTSELEYSLKEISEKTASIVDKLEPEKRKEVHDLLNDDLPESMRFISTSVDKMDHMLSSILKLSRLGRRVLEFEPIDLHSLCNEILSSLSYIIEQTKTEVVLGNLPVILNDRVVMEQILGNMLDNAVKYLDPNRPGSIVISSKASDSGITLSVKDNGRGIQPHEIEKVFQIFRRGMHQNVAGEGMGLSYVQTLVRAQGGRINFEPAPDFGTVFTIYLPLQNGK